MFRFKLHRSQTGWIAAAMVLALSLPAYGAGKTGNSSGLTKFTVAMVSSIDTEPYFYALSQGYYKKVGLDVTLTQSDSGPALVTGVLNGTYDAASAAAFPILIAIGKGLPLKFYPGVALVAPNHGNSGLVVKPDSPIKGFADVAGKTIATNALTSLTTLALKIGIKQAGADPNSVKIVALPFKSSVQAVAQGQADAAVVISPFETIAENNGLNVIADPIGEMMPKGAPYNIIFTTTKNSAAKKKEFAAFHKATAKAVTALAANEKLLRELAHSKFDLAPEVAKTVPLPDWSTNQIDLKAFQKYADYVAEFGYTDKSVDVSKVVVNP